MQVQEKWLNDFTALGKEVSTEKGPVRPETKTSIAIGKVFKIEEVGKDNLKVTMKVAGAKYDFNGFLNDKTPVAELIKEAHSKNLVIAGRFEKKRKKNVDPSLSIEEITKDAFVARDNIVNIVAGVYNFHAQQWILTEDAVSNPEEDPDYVSAGLASATYTTEGFFQSPTKNEQQYVPRVMKDSNDSRANHLISMYHFGSEHNLENNIGLESKAIRALATYMLRACDQLQMKIYNLDTPNYADYSHTKSRGMLFSWMKLNPLSSEIMSKKGGFNEWITRFIEESTELWEWAKSEDQ